MRRREGEKNRGPVGDLIKIEMDPLDLAGRSSKYIEMDPLDLAGRNSK